MQNASIVVECAIKNAQNAIDNGDESSYNILRMQSESNNKQLYGM